MQHLGSFKVPLLCARALNEKLLLFSRSTALALSESQPSSSRVLGQSEKNPAGEAVLLPGFPDSCLPSLPSCQHSRQVKSMLHQCLGNPARAPWNTETGWWWVWHWGIYIPSPVTGACQLAALFFAGLHVFSVVPVSPLVVPSKASCYGALKSLPLSCHLEIQQYSYHLETKRELCFFLRKVLAWQDAGFFQFEQK